MAKAKIIFKSKEEIYGYFPAGKELINYRGVLTVKDSGKAPVSLVMKFVPPHPFVFEMPEKHSIKAETITDVYAKVVKFFKKYSVELH